MMVSIDAAGKTVVMRASACTWRHEVPRPRHPILHEASAAALHLPSEPAAAAGCAAPLLGAEGHPLRLSLQLPAPCNAHQRCCTCMAEACKEAQHSRAPPAPSLEILFSAHGQSCWMGEAYHNITHTIKMVQRF
jgi:hypothetical protein